MSQAQPPPGYYAPYPPYLPYAPPKPPKARPAWLTAIIVIVVICVGLPILGAVISALGAVVNHPASFFGTPTATAAPARVGQALTSGGVSCTLVSIKPLAGDQFIAPKAGNVFLVARVWITNHSGGEYSYADSDFHAKTSAGVITGTALTPSTYTANVLLGGGSLTDGGTVIGDLIVEVPAHDHAAELTWSPGFFSDDTSLAWNLGR